MAALTDAQLTVLATTIQNNSTAASNSHTLVGEFLNDVVDSKQNIASAVVTVKVTLTSSQILALNSTPITLVAAQGAGTFINVILIAMRLNYGSVTYTTNTTTRLAIGSFSPITTDSTILAGTTTNFAAITATQSLVVTGAADWVNIPLKISAVSGNPAAGNSTLDVYVTYNILTL